MEDQSNEECLKYWLGRLCDAHKEGNMKDVSKFALIIKQYADWMSE